MKNDGRKTTFLLGRPIFRGYVKFPGCNICGWRFFFRNPVMGTTSTAKTLAWKLIHTGILEHHFETKQQRNGIIVWEVFLKTPNDSYERVCSPQMASRLSLMLFVGHNVNKTQNLLVCHLGLRLKELKTLAYFDFHSHVFLFGFSPCHKPSLGGWFGTSCHHWFTM